MNDLKIFCIDDEPRALNMIGQVVTDSGFEVTCHKNPMTAIETILKDDYAVVLADINMPEVSGFDIVKALEKENYPCISILLTGMESSKYVEEAVKAGQVWKYLVKPISIERLQETIEEAVEAYKEKYS